MTDAIAIDAATTIDQEIADAMARLLPQLTPSVNLPGVVQLQQVASSPNATLLLARDQAHQGQVVGAVTLVVFRTPTGVRARIEDLVVDAAARGKGVGEALTREALRLARSHGAVTVELTSRASREAANRLYRRLGFVLHETNVYRFNLNNDAGQ